MPYIYVELNILNWYIHTRTSPTYFTWVNENALKDLLFRIWIDHKEWVSITKETNNYNIMGFRSA